MLRRFVIAFACLVLGTAYVIDAVGWRGAEPEPRGIQVVATWGELLTQPAFELASDARVRVGLERSALDLAADRALLYLAFERDLGVDSVLGVLERDRREPLAVLVRVTWGPGSAETSDHLVFAQPQPRLRGVSEVVGRLLRVQPIDAQAAGVIQVALFRARERERRGPWDDGDLAPSGEPLVEGRLRVSEFARWSGFRLLGQTRIDGVQADARLARTGQVRLGGSSPVTPTSPEALLPRTAPPSVDPTLHLAATAEGFELTSETMIPFQFPHHYLLVRLRRVVALTPPTPRPALGSRPHVLRARVDWGLAALGLTTGDRVAVELLWTAGGDSGLPRSPEDVRGSETRRSNTVVFTVR